MKKAACEPGLRPAETPARQAPALALVPLVLFTFAIAGCGGESARLPTATHSAETTVDDQAQADEDAAIAAAEPIDPKSIAYQECRHFFVRAASARALAVDALDRIYVGDDKGILRYSSNGQEDASFKCTAAPRCLAIGGNEHRYSGRIYAGYENHIAVVDAGGRQIASWASLGDKASISSIAVAEDSVFVADAGNRIVWHYDTGGKIVGRIGDADSARHVPGFMITNHFFDVALGGDGLVYAVNPRALRIEGYTHQGDLETHWGKGSPAVEDFFGCCNPVHLAVMPDGRFVTAEKGIARVKIYSREGTFLCVAAAWSADGRSMQPGESASQGASKGVAAGTGQFSASTALAGLAVDSQRRVIVLVSSDHPMVEIFVPKVSNSAPKL
jgi:hypothetical protein